MAIFLKKLPALQTESTSIYLLDLDIRSYKCLKAERIDTIEQLVKCSAKDLLNTPNLGRKSIDLIRSVLAKRGLKLLGD